MKSTFVILFITIFTSFLFFSCEKDYPVCPTVKLENENLAAEEMDVLTTVFSEFHKNGFIHIIQQTYFDNDSAANAKYILEIVKRFNLTIDSSLIVNYLKNNLTSKNILNSGIFNLINQKEISCMFSLGCDEGYTSYYSKYKKSNGFIKFNRPGILNDTAILDYGIYYDCLGAEGFFVVLRKSAGKWKIEKRVTIWIS